MTAFFDPFSTSLLMLVPTLIFAIFVERHYTAFWTGFWNFFALFVTGISLLFSPFPPSVSGFNILPIVLILLGFVLMALSFFVAPLVARLVGSSHITASILLAVYIFQLTLIEWVFWLSLIISFILIFIIKRRM